MKSKRSKACDISQITKKIVFERDNGRCIFCGSTQAMPNAHFIPRSKGGVGIEKNVVKACLNCHHKLDQSTNRKEMLDYTKKYLMSNYDNWTQESLVYKK